MRQLRTLVLYCLAGLWIVLSAGLRTVSGNVYEICLNPQHDHRSDSLGCDATDLLGGDDSKHTCKHKNHLKPKADRGVFDIFHADAQVPDTHICAQEGAWVGMDLPSAATSHGFCQILSRLPGFRGPPVWIEL